MPVFNNKALKTEILSQTLHFVKTSFRLLSSSYMYVKNNVRMKNSYKKTLMKLTAGGTLNLQSFMCNLLSAENNKINNPLLIRGLAIKLAKKLS